MDPPTQPNLPPQPPKARLQPTASLPMQPVEAADGQGGSGAGVPPRQPRWIVPLSTLLTLVLLAAGVWWYMARGHGGVAEGPAGLPGVPKDAVALINSTTPLPTQIVGGPSDAVGNLAFAPDSQSWSGALREAHRAQDEGRYSAAISQYSALVGGSGSTQEARDALWGLASALWQGGQGDLALRAYTLLSGLDDPRAPRAYAMIAHIYEQTNRAPEAVRAYNSYLQRAGPARHAIMLMEARLMGATPDAEATLQAVLDGHPSDIDERDALAALADVKARRGDHKAARDLYNRLAALQLAGPRPLLDNYGPPAAVLAAEEAKAVGDATGAEKQLLSYIKGECGDKKAACPPYPYGRYSALTSLLKMQPSAVVSGTVPPLQAAHIAYDAGYYAKATGYLDTARGQLSDPAQLAEAGLLTGKAFELSGDTPTAYKWYTDTVQHYPTSAYAPEANRQAGDTLRDAASWDEAMGAYRQTIQLYPNAGQETALARLHGGVLAYRLEQRDVALDLLMPITSSSEVSPTVRGEASFWVGKLQRSAGDIAWKSTMQAASSLEPGTFADFRARALLNGEADGGPLVPAFGDSSTGALGVQYDTEGGERAAFLTWAGTITGTNATQTATPAEGIAPAFAGDAELQRAVSLLQLGFDQEAYRSFRVLGERLKDSGDAVSLAGLVTYLRYHASPNTAMRVADLLATTDSGDPLKRPTLLLKTLYPTPYKELVTAEARERDVDPLAMYALMRQESQFIPGARSGADARGLAQVIPSTGRGIADRLGDANYSASDLYLPYVAVRYGTYYLASNLPTFDRKLLPTLAAYNAGPGNAAKWLAGSALLDPDLYIERVDLFETADYLGKVYVNYGFYRQVYGR